MKITGAQALLECLKREGVEVIFGLPGGVTIPIYDCLFDCQYIKHILVRHEQGAAHAAEGYSRTTGKVGVCLATSGPGATNLITGLANAYMDSIPMVAITGQVRTTVLGKDAFQEADITGITMPITKHNMLIKNADELPRAIAEAFHIARTGRPGPVLIDIPVDISSAMIHYKPIESVDIPSYKPTMQGHPMQIRKAAKAIMDAKKPVLYVGGGAISSGCHDEIDELVKRTNIPITTTLLGKGIYDETCPLSLGMLGMHGTAYANYAIAHCDLLIAIGARFDDRVTGAVDKFAKHAKVIHIDIDPAEIGKTIRPEIPIVGDCKLVLQELLEHIQPKPDTDWNEQVRTWVKMYPLSYPANENLYVQHVCKRIDELTGGEAIVTTGVGQHQMWAAQFIKSKYPKRWVSSGGLGTMGFGMPSAIGAKVGNPDKEVWCIDGDGSFQMTSMELMTAVENDIAIRVAITNNQYLGMVRQWQELFWKERYSGVDHANQPDFVKLAEAYGAIGLRAYTREECDAVIKEAMTYKNKPVIIDFRVFRMDNVYPMIPAGKSIDEIMIQGPK